MGPENPDAFEGNGCLLLAPRGGPSITRRTVDSSRHGEKRVPGPDSSTDEEPGALAAPDRSTVWSTHSPLCDEPVHRPVPGPPLRIERDVVSSPVNIPRPRARRASPARRCET